MGSLNHYTGRAGSLRLSIPQKEKRKKLLWSPKNKNEDQKLTFGSNKKVLWKCEKDYCKHEWSASVKFVINYGRGCPKCGKKRLRRQFTSLAEFLPSIKEIWHPSKNLPKTYFDVSYGSDEKIHCLCKKCKTEWKVTPHNLSNGKGCPTCAESGFQITEPGFIYLNRWKIKGKTFLEFGITKSLQTRLSQKKNDLKKQGLEFEVEQICANLFITGKRAQKIESLIKMNFKPHLNEAGKHNIYFSGSTETVPVSKKTEVLALIEKHSRNKIA